MKRALSHILNIILVWTLILPGPIHADYKLSSDTSLDEEKFLAVSRALSGILAYLDSPGSIEGIKDIFIQSFLETRPAEDPSHYRDHLKIAYYKAARTFYIYSTSPRNGQGVVYCIYPEEYEERVPLIQDAEALKADTIGGFKLKVFTKTPPIEAELKRLSRDYKNLLLADVGSMGKGRPKQDTSRIPREELSGGPYPQLFNLLIEEIQLRLEISGDRLNPSQADMIEQVIRHLRSNRTYFFRAIVDSINDYLFGFAEQEAVCLGREFFMQEEDLHLFLTEAFFHEGYHSLRYSDPNEDGAHREAILLQRVLFKENFSPQGDSFLGRAIRRKIEERLRNQPQARARINPQTLIDEINRRIAELKRYHRINGGDNQNGLIDASFDVELGLNICDNPGVLIQNTIYAIRCLFHAARSGEPPNMEKINDFFSIFDARCRARYRSVERTGEEFNRRLERFRQLSCFRRLEDFPKVHIRVEGSLENEYIERHPPMFSEGIYPCLARVSYRTDGIYIYLPNKQIAGQLSYRNIMLLLIFALTSDADSIDTGSFDPEGVYDPALAALIQYCWDVGPIHQMRYYSEEERDRIIDGISIRSLGSLGREEARREKEDVRAILREMLTPTEGWPWHLFYNYILSIFQGRGHSRRRLSIEIYDPTAHPPVGGGRACYRVGENKIYINRYALFTREDGRGVRFTNWFTTDYLISMLLEEIFHADADIIRPQEDVVAGIEITENLTEEVILQVLLTGGIDQQEAKAAVRAIAVRDLHGQTVNARRILRNMEIRRLLGHRYREEFNGEILEDDDGERDIEHENLLNLIGDWFYQRKKRELGQEQADLYAETFGGPHIGVSAFLDTRFESIEPLRVLDGRVYHADLRLTRDRDGRYIIYSREEEGGVRMVGGCFIVRDGDTSRFLFTFLPGYEYLRLSSDVLTAVTHLIRINDPSAREARITIHIDDVPASNVPFGLNYKESSIERVYAEPKPAGIIEPPLSEEADSGQSSAGDERDGSTLTIQSSLMIPGLGAIAVQIQRDGSIVYGTMRAGAFSELPEELQGALSLLFDEAVYSMPDVQMFLTGLRPILITRERRRPSSLGGKKNDVLGFVPAVMGERIGDTRIDRDNMFIFESDVAQDVISEMQSTADVLEGAFKAVLSKYEDNPILGDLIRNLRAKDAVPRGFSFICDPDFIGQTLPPNFHLPNSDTIAFDTDTAKLLPPEQGQVLFALAVVHELGHLAGMNEEEALDLTLSFIEIMDPSDRALLDSALESPYLDGSGRFKEFIKSAGRDRAEKARAIRDILSLDKNRAEVVLKLLESGLFKGAVNRILFESELRRLEETFGGDTAPLVDLAMGLPSDRIAQLETDTPMIAGVLRESGQIKFWPDNKAAIGEITAYLRRLNGYSNFSKLPLMGKRPRVGQKGLKIYYDVSNIMEMDANGDLRARTTGWNELIRLIREANQGKKPEDTVEIVLVTPWDRDTTLRAFYSLFDAGIVGNTLEGVSEIITEDALTESISSSKKPVAGITVNGDSRLAKALAGRPILAAPFGSLSIIEQTAIVQAIAEKGKPDETILHLPIIGEIRELYRGLLSDIDPSGLEGIFTFQNGILYFNLPPICRNLLEQLNEAVTTKISERYA